MMEVHMKIRIFGALCALICAVAPVQAQSIYQEGKGVFLALYPVSAYASPWRFDEEQGTIVEEWNLTTTWGLSFMGTYRFTERFDATAYIAHNRSQGFLGLGYTGRSENSPIGFRYSLELVGLSTPRLAVFVYGAVEAIGPVQAYPGIRIRTDFRTASGTGGTSLLRRGVTDAVAQMPVNVRVMRHVQMSLNPSYRYVVDPTPEYRTSATMSAGVQVNF
jgi:hypothetical protein